MNDPRSQTYEFDGYRLDADKRLLTKADGEVLPVTPRVFDTLLYLVRNSGKVIGKDELMREIWTDSIVEENNLSQNISNLRRILGEKPGEGRFIATVPGHGFRFVPTVRNLSEVLPVVDEELSLEPKPADDANAGDAGKRQVASDPVIPNLQHADARKTNRLLLAVPAVLIAILLSSVGYYLWRENAVQSHVDPIRSIAILPFKPLVAQNRDEVLEMGMADTLISRLGNNSEMVVRPLSSVRKFADLEQDAAAAGRALDVEAVLDGSIQRWGDEIRVNARLTRVADGSLLWTATFDEKFSGIFAVQDAIANRVAAALTLRLGDDEKNRLAKHYTENVEAYQLYLTGRFHVFKLTPKEVQRGISYFEQAIALDQRYALAYAGLADAHRSLALGSEFPPTDSLLKAKVAAERAVELDGSLSEAHTALAMTIFWFDWNWQLAEDHFQRALVLDPNSASAHLFYSHLLTNLGRHEQALTEIKLARQLDPLFPFAGAIEGQALAFAGRTDEALDTLRKTSELDPNFWMPYLFASRVYVDKGMYAEAVEAAHKARNLAPAQSASIAFESYALAQMGKRDEARAALDELTALSRERFVPPLNFALAYNGLGETDEALDWLERGFEQRDPKMTFLKIDSRLNNLRGEPRFIQLMDRMAFPR